MNKMKITGCGDCGSNQIEVIYHGDNIDSACELEANCHYCQKTSKFIIETIEANNTEEIKAIMPTVNINDGLPTQHKSRFTDRENDLIKNCLTYSRGTPAGLPGHNLMVIITKMADLIVDLDYNASLPRDTSNFTSFFDCLDRFQEIYNSMNTPEQIVAGSRLSNQQRKFLKKLVKQSKKSNRYTPLIRRG